MAHPTENGILVFSKPLRNSITTQVDSLKGALPGQISEYARLRSWKAEGYSTWPLAILLYLQPSVFNLSTWVVTKFVSINKKRISKVLIAWALKPSRPAHRQGGKPFSSPPDPRGSRLSRKNSLTADPSHCILLRFYI
jgi:hypothetical protein